MNISVDLSGLSKRLKRLDETLAISIKQEGMLKEIGEAAIKDIQFQTRRGINGAYGNRLASLSKDWIEKRGDLASRGLNTHPAFEKRRSNLTITGQLLDSIKIKLFQGAAVVIGFTGVHKGYSVPYLSHYVRTGKKRKGANNKTVKGFNSTGGMHYVNTNRSGMTKPGDDISNAELASHISKSRPFFSIRQEMLNRFKSIVIRYIRRNIK